MAFRFLTLIYSAYAANSQTTVYTAPISTQTRIDAISVTNNDTVVRTISINIVPSGGSASAANRTTNAQAIFPGQTWVSPNEAGQVLNAGDFISMIASAATALTVTASGVQQS